MPTVEQIRAFVELKLTNQHCCCLEDEPSHESIILELCRQFRDQDNAKQA